MTFLGKKCNFEIMITVYFQLALCGGEKKREPRKNLIRIGRFRKG